MLRNQKKYIALAILTPLYATQANAAGLERAPQSVDALFESGTYAEVGYAYISPDISGHDIATGGQPSHTISNMAKDFESFNYAVKVDLSDKFKLAVMYDEPFGAKVEFKGENNFVDDSRQGEDRNTRVTVKSKNITTLLGYNINKNVMIYGGPALQELSADVHLRGVAYGAGAGYDNRFSSGIDVGWVAGISYAKPEYGILASLTYRSEIHHKMNIEENMPLADLLNLDYAHSNKGKVTTPESFNLNLQTGINSTTAVFAKIRYIPWGSFEYRPPVLDHTTQVALGSNQGLPLLNYSKDQTSVELGVGKKLSPKLTLAVSGLWDSGAGNPVTTLGPVEGYWGAGLAAKYNITEHLALSLGGRYLWFGNAKGNVPDGQIVGEFSGNTGYVLGMKLSYNSK
ncbi:OmpP1/FadL family transporter [Acinetobacter sp. MB5]|uniref:OmpP1/FadL family transporter n=1 Tax=Acinetobacter sp. MB5 TaxID=2069438 RepID=UPI000DCFD440|nr:outer membrane protein transport protein [Acinetobacter sp. MB5]